MKEALRNIWRRKVRSALTIFGVAIGIFALVTMGSLATNLDRTVDSALDHYTSRVTVSAEGAGSAGNAGAFAQGGQVPAGLADRLKVFEGVLTAYPTITLQVTNDLATYSEPPLIYGFRPGDAVQDPKPLKIATGRALTEGDVGKVVVGSNIIQTKKQKIGDQIELRGRKFEIVGTLQRMGGGLDSFYLITLSEAQDMVRETSVFNPTAATLVTDIVVIPKPGQDADALAKRIDEQIPGVHAMPPQEFRKQIEQASQVFTLIIYGSALIALIVGSLSVINTMIMSVTERRKEIGIKRIVGARLPHILSEIITETAVMGLLGGLIGVLAGAALVIGINKATADSGLQIFTLTPELALASLVFATVLGIVAGLYPAWRANRIKPVTVLRDE